MTDRRAPRQPPTFLHGEDDRGHDIDPFDDPRWEWFDHDEDDSPMWERLPGVERCRGRTDGWSFGCFNLADIGADDGLCASCRGKPVPESCTHCGLAPPAYADGSCRTCYRWLARNRKKYAPDELLIQLAKRVACRVERAAKQPHPKKTSRSTRP